LLCVEYRSSFINSRTKSEVGMEAKTIRGFEKYKELIEHYEQKWGARLVIHGSPGTVRNHEFIKVQRACTGFDCYDLTEEEAKFYAIVSGLGAVCIPVLKSGRKPEKYRLLYVKRTTIKTGKGIVEEGQINYVLIKPTTVNKS
jgi:hypothetical protein